MAKHSGSLLALDEDALEDLIEDELKKYEQFQAFVDEKTNAHLQIEASIKVLHWIVTNQLVSGGRFAR